MQKRPPRRTKIATTTTTTTTTGTTSSKHHANASLATIVQKVVFHPKNGNNTTDHSTSLFHSILRAVVDQSSTRSKNRRPTKANAASTAAASTSGNHPYNEMISTVIQSFLKQVSTEINTNVYPQMDDTNVILLHLYHWIFASVGGGATTLVDPSSTSTKNNDDNDDHAATTFTSLEDMTEEDWTNHIDLVVEEMSQNTTTSSFTITTKATSSMTTAQQDFNTIYSEFWYHLTTVLLTSYNSNNDADDDNDDQGRFRVDMVRQIVSRLIELVNVGVPDIRYAMSIAIYQMGLALLQYTTTLQQKVGPVQRQYHAAQQNHQKKKASAMQNQIQLWKRTMTDCEEIVKELIVTTVFTIRYKDHDPMIRKVSLQSLHQYCMIRSDLFLASLYLKYFGWMMSDKHPIVRIAAIHGLMKPLAHNVVTDTHHHHHHRSPLSRNDQEVDITSNMTSVVTKFLPRIVDCVIDVDVTVQETAMEFVLLLLRHYEFFNDIENDRMWNQINIRALDPCTSQHVRTNALYFVLEQLDLSSTSTTASPTTSSTTHSSERTVVTQLYAIGNWYVSVWCFMLHETIIVLKINASYIFLFVIVYFGTGLLIHYRIAIFRFPKSVTIWLIILSCH
jgi:cohesin complex subunit SA-1/2